jgi:cell division protease FtsH
MAATNRPDVLDPALLRPGCFDRQIVVDRPDMRGREAILRVHSRGVKLAPNIDLHAIAARTPSFVGADLANVVNEAALLAARHGKQVVEMVDFEEAVDRVISGLERKDRIISDHEKETVSVHEMGHALVALLLPYTDPVHKVTIVSRGTSALGMTLQLPLQDKYLFQKEELENRIAVALGGRVAEQLMLGRISTGAHNDLINTTRLVRRMVTEFGMSEKLGPLTFSEAQSPTLEVTVLESRRSTTARKPAGLLTRKRRRLSTGITVLPWSFWKKIGRSWKFLSKELMEKETIQGTELTQRFKELRRQLSAIPEPAALVEASISRDLGGGVANEHHGNYWSTRGVDYPGWILIHIISIYLSLIPNIYWQI